jgi:hypothetical protein
MLKFKLHKWKTAPISPTCEVLRLSGMCDQPTSFAYPAMGGGWMALCYKHGLKHIHAIHVDKLIASGEKWQC